MFEGSGQWVGLYGGVRPERINNVVFSFRAEQEWYYWFN